MKDDDNDELGSMSIDDNGGGSKDALTIEYVTRQFFIPSGPFSPEDTEENILFEETGGSDGKPMIKAATLEKLVERVTHEAYPDPKYMARFLLTYRSFTTGADLVDLLRQRCELPVPKGLSAEELDNFQKKLQTPVRLRVLNLVKSWVSQYIHDFADDPDFLQKFDDFLGILQQYDGLSLGAKSIQMQLKKKLKGLESKKREVVYRTDPPKPIKPHIKGSISLLQLNPTEIARQLTVIEADLYRKIKPWEFLNQAWAKKGGVNAPNVLEMIHFSTRVSGFVATEIMKAHISDKVKYISHFIQVAKALRDLNNFNALMEIIAGFENAAVWRLQPFFQEVPKRYSSVLEDLHSVMNTAKNFASIRAMLKTVDMPCIPYLGMFLTDLTFIEDGNPDNVKNDLINFTKRRYVAQVIQDIQQYQQTPFCLLPEPIIQGYLKGLYLWDEEKLYQYSQEFMPRSAKDKTVKELEVLYLEKEKEKKLSRKKEKEEEEDWGNLEQIPGYPFYDKDSAENVSFDENGKFVAATLPKLVQRLTAQPTPGFMETFLLTWPTFCSAEECAKLLLFRYNVPSLIGADEKKNEEYEKRTFTIKSRVINILKALVDKFSFHFSAVIGLYDVVFNLLQELRKTAGVLAGAIDRIEKNMKAMNSKNQKQFEKRETPSFPGGDGHGILKFHPSHIAAALSLSHHQIFVLLKPHCLLNLNISDYNPTIQSAKWNDKMQKFVNLFVDAETFLYDFVVSTIVSSNTPSDRANVIEFFLDICDECAKLRNYAAVLWILQGISSKTIRRLTTTWSKVTSAYRSKFKDLQKTIKECVNVHTFRERTYEPGDRFTVACVPPISGYIYSYLQRLQLPDTTESGLINFEKREGMGSLVHDILKLQNVKYDVTEYPDIARFIGFQQKKLRVKGDLLSRVAKVLAEEPEGFTSEHEDNFLLPLVPPEQHTAFVGFAKVFTKNNSIFTYSY